MTAAMLCALTGSNDCLKVLLEAGGVDIHVIDSNKLSAYQTALNSKNDEAVKMLLQYESRPKRNQMANT
jgi:ankyrin repeat protein